jgi:hypothetical protein
MGSMMKSDNGLYLGNITQDLEAVQPTLNPGERLIRLVLVAGFATVLALEAWLLLQVVQF